MYAVFVTTLQEMFWNACAVKNVAKFLVLKIGIEVKELFSTLLKIEDENFYKTAPCDWWNTHV
jgi:hypothetical protein